MPEYFFHVSLEMFRETKEQPKDLYEGAGAATRSALNAFLHPENHRHILNGISDSALHSNRHRNHTPPRRQPVRDCRSIAQQTVPSSAADHRLDYIYIDGTDMSTRKSAAPPEENAETSGNHINKGIGASTTGLQTKGRYAPLERETAEGGWGIVHLYRDAEETPGLYGESPLRGADIWFEGVHAQKKSPSKPHPPPKDEECTTLCILAVPSYLAPADFLAFVGEETRNEVSHFRMIRTARANRYMVLMKFRHGKKAREWQREWNGKVFNSMEPETCHVVFLKSVEIIQSSASTESAPSDTTYPKTPNDPFSAPSMSTTATATPTTKPLPPPTPSLIELPTCPVCLERMDETTGLLTILCQHVFHCTCLQKWSGGGCPVCRYTHDDFSSRLGHGQSHHKQKAKKKILSKIGYEFEPDDYDAYGNSDTQECETCHIENNLWQCLICGRVGCGRYEGKHAYAHFEESGHTFSMDLESKRVWDYAGDGYVHRIIQDAQGHPGEKLVELPGRRSGGDGGVTALNGRADDDEWGDKMDNVALEYTHLLTSQLESQRVYFEEVVERAVDKASEAGRRAGEASSKFESLQIQLVELRLEHTKLSTEVVPDLTRERDRATKRADKFETLSREMEKRYSTEKTLVGNLMERIKFLEAECEKTKAAVEPLKARVVDLEEENRDLMMNFAMEGKIAELAGQEGDGTGEDMVGERLELLTRRGRGRGGGKIDC